MAVPPDRSASAPASSTGDTILELKLRAPDQSVLDRVRESFLRWITDPLGVSRIVRTKRGPTRIALHQTVDEANTPVLCIKVVWPSDARHDGASSSDPAQRPAPVLARTPLVPSFRVALPVAGLALTTLLLTAVTYVARPAPRATVERAERRPAPLEIARTDVVAPVSVAPVEPPSVGSEPPAAPQAARPVTTSARTPGPRRAMGALLITSQPRGAAVSLNGVPKGRTPLRLTGLRAGSRVLSLILPGYERWSWSVAVVAQRATPVAVKLQPDPKSANAPE